MMKVVTRVSLSIAASLALMLALAPAARADLSPSYGVLIPEAIWAPATGGGTWVTALQVTAKTSGTVVTAFFFHASGYRAVTLLTSTADLQTFRIPNILETMQALDSGFVYEGCVGALVLEAASGRIIWAQAMTTNGNYGKTMPGYDAYATASSADVGRDMVIPGVINDSTYRFFVGAVNMRDTFMTVRFHVMTSAGTSAGYVERTILPYRFVAFNPFTELGITDPCTNYWLRISPVTSGGSGYGLFCYGSLANNVTNDTSAMIAIPFE
jgi:hypothetical protein